MRVVAYDGFDWDAGNRAKSAKHGVSEREIEALFQGNDVRIAPDPVHSTEAEERFLAIGRPGQQARPIFVVFTIRRRGQVLIRPISARDMHEKEARRFGY